MRYAAAAIGMTFATTDIRASQAERRAQRTARRRPQAEVSSSKPSKPRRHGGFRLLLPHPTP